MKNSICFIVLHLLFIGTAFCQDEPSLTSKNTCLNQDTGSIKIDFEHSMIDFPFPYQGSYYNTTTGAYKEIKIEHNPFLVQGLEAGEYKFQIFISEVDIMELCSEVENVQIDIQFQKTPACDNDGTIEAIVWGGEAPYEYAWLDNEEETGNTRSNLNSNLYTLVITDHNGCTNAASGYIKNYPNLNLSTNVAITPSSCDQNTGIINYWKNDASGGAGSPYSLDWSNGDTGIKIENLYAGDYTLTVTDAEGCTITATHTVPGEGQPSTFPITYSACANVPDGKIILLFTAEVGPLDYAWDSSLDDHVEVLDETIVQISNLYAGTYCITATDIGNGCFVNACNTVNIIETEELVIQNAIIKPSCNFETNGSILPIASGGYGIKNYNWSNGYDKIWPRNLLPGNYSVTVSDICGNSAIANYQIIGVNFDLEVAANIKCVNVNTDIGSIDLTVEGNNPPYSFHWSNGATTEDIQVSQYGEYSVTIKDTNGCEYFDTYQVNETFGTLTANVTISDLSNCEDQMEISVSATVFGGDAPYNYKWNDGSEENYMKVNIPNSDQESALIYSVTITDQCGNEKIISDNFVCNDICPDDCIVAYKTGKECTDYCNDHPLYGDDIGCDKIKIKCNCDDGVTRKVIWKNGWEEAIFIGKEPKEGSYIEEKVNTWDPLTYTFFIHNEKTGCVSKRVITRKEDRCGWGFFPWIFETFGNGPATSNPDIPCTDEEDWHLISFDLNECEETYECDEDTDRIRTIKSIELCKIQDSSTGLWGVYEYCEPTCTLLSTISSSEEEPDGMKKCPDCLPGLVDPCNDPLDLFTYPDLNGHLSFFKNKDKEHFITEVLDSSGVLVRSITSENLRGYLLKFIRITDKEILAILLHKVTLEYSLVKIMQYEEYEIINTFNGEVVENLIVTGVDATCAHIITRVKTTNEYKKYYYDIDTRTISIISENHFSTGKIIWNTISSYFEVNSNNSGFNYIVQNGDGFTQSNTIDSKVLVKTIDQYLDGYLVTGIFTGTLDVNDQVYNSNNQYSTIIYWFDSNGTLIRYYILENKIITRISIKNSIIVCMGYDLETNFIQEEYLEETIYLQNNDDLCSFTEIIDLSNTNSFQYDENLNSRNTSKVSVKIFPNPTRNSISIAINNGDTSTKNKFIAQIRNIYGSKVNFFAIDAKGNIDLSKLSSGIYFLSILDEEGNAIFAEKIVKL